MEPGLWLCGTDGTFHATPVSYVAGSTPTSVAVADLTGDGSVDLAVANSLSNNVSILLNDHSWPAGPPRPGGGALATAKCGGGPEPLRRGGLVPGRQFPV
jgi:hypothetical protein